MAGRVALSQGREEQQVLRMRCARQHILNAMEQACLIAQSINHLVLRRFRQSCAPCQLSLQGTVSAIRGKAINMRREDTCSVWQWRHINLTEDVGETASSGRYFHLSVHWSAGGQQAALLAQAGSLPVLRQARRLRTVSVQAL